MRRAYLALIVVLAAACSSEAPTSTSVPPDQSPPQPVAPLPAGPVPTSTVVLSFLTSGVTDTTLMDGVESIVQQFQVYAPCHPLFSTIAAFSIRPVVGCPLPYTVWETELDVAPATVVNPSGTSVLLTTTIYSDNGYVYQQQQTVQPGSRAVVVPGSLQLGFICSDGYPMPVTVSFRASGADLVLLRSTTELAGANAPKFPDYPKVWGSTVVLLPIDGESDVCAIE
jgi:hypothetical protein